MAALRLAGCPVGTRFVVLKLEKVSFWHSQVSKVHGYIGPIELNQLFVEGKLHNLRIYPRPMGGTEQKYDWKEPPIGEMWMEGLTVSELQEYFDYE